MGYESIILENVTENHRPWGFYEILSDSSDHRVKRITVYPGQRLSYQRHSMRSEHWYLIMGKGIVTKNGRNIDLMTGETLEIPLGTWHRIYNTGIDNLVFIEIQTGSYFGEDDIERSEDDYGRV